MIYDASKKAKILTYTNLHRPIAECADVVWDSLTSNKIHDIEVVQNSPIPFIIHTIKTGTLTLYLKQEPSYYCSSSLWTIEEQNHRLRVSTRILQNEDQHNL